MAVERGRGSSLADFLDSAGGAAYQRANNPLAQIQNADLAATGEHGEELTVGKYPAPTPAGQALGDLAMAGRGPAFSPLNPYAQSVQGAIQAQARENMYNRTGAQAGPFGQDRPMGSAAPAALGDAMARALEYQKTLDAYGGGGAPTATPKQGFARVTPRKGRPSMSGAGALMGTPRY